MPGLSALIPLDGTKLSESSFALLPFLKLLGFTKLELVSVWESGWDEREAIPSRREGEIGEVGEKGRAYLHAYLGVESDRVRAQGFEAESTVDLGRAADAVLKTAAETSADLILIATHGRDGLARWRLGSVADKIIRQATCPTLVIGPNVNVELAPYALKRVLVPLDGSALAETALPIASFVATAASADLDLVRVVSMAPMAYDQSMGAYPVDLLSAMEDAARIYLERKAGEFAGKHKVETSVLIGSAGEQILEYLRGHPAGLVVMASHGRAGVARAALGSVADRVLHGPAPVLILQPEEEMKSQLVAAALGAAR